MNRFPGSGWNLNCNFLLKKGLDMKLLITGSNGQLGRALWLALRDSNHDIVFTDVWDRGKGIPEQFLIKDIEYLDITDEVAVEKMISRVRPEVVINCAAHTAVDLCEEQEELAERINAKGPENLAKSLEGLKGTLVQISTDYVFDGAGTRPYVEEDEPNPVTVYGRTKCTGEKLVAENISRYFIIRTAWLYGDGKNFVRTMLRLSGEHSRLKVVSDQKGSPTSAAELAKMILNLIGAGEKPAMSPFGIYHGTCEGETTWFEFTKKIFEIADINCEVLPVTTEEYGAKAKRPAYSVLENKKYNQLGFPGFKQWEEALRDYLKCELQYCEGER